MVTPQRLEFTIAKSEYYVLDSDQTFYFELSDKVISAIDGESASEHLTVDGLYRVLGWNEGEPKSTWDGDVVVRLERAGAGGAANGLQIAGRGHLCGCFSGKYAALVVRVEARTLLGKNSEDLPAATQKKLNDGAAKRRGDIPSAFASKRLKTEGDFYTGFREVYDAAWRVFYRSEPAKPTAAEPLERGLILVAGRTGVGKSRIVRGIIHCAMQTWRARDRDRGMAKRNFHLVTLEDPIEEKLVADPRVAQLAGIDYTPRVLGVDATSVSAAMNDARRQTPSLYYIGEVRRDEDWPDILRFVEGGHLVIATTHAGSLVECFHKVMTGQDEKSPAARSHIGGLIRGVLQLHAGQREEERKNEEVIHRAKSFTIPTAWARTPEGVASYVSNGSSAIVPHFDEPAELELIPKKLRGHLNYIDDTLCFEATSAAVKGQWQPGDSDASKEKDPPDVVAPWIKALNDWEINPIEDGPPKLCSLGRRWFARDLARQTSVAYGIEWGERKTKRLFEDIEKKCIEWDLRGE